MEPTEFDGAFWLEPDGKEVRGHVSFDPESGLELKLHGRFETADPDEPRLIYGRSSTGRCILSDCYRLSASFGGPCGGLASETYRGGLLIQGLGLDPSQLVVSKGQLRFTDLDSWVNRNPFKITRGDPEPYSLQVGVDLHPTIEHQTRYGSFRLAHGYDSSFADSVSLEAHWSVVVEPTQPMTFPEFQATFVRPLQDFFTVQAGRANALTGFKFRTPEMEAGRFARVSYPSIYAGRPKSLGAQELTIRLDDLPNAADQIERWLDLRGPLAPSRTLVTGIDYREGSFVDQRFFFAATAAEACHALLVGGTPLPQEEHQSRLDQALAPLEGKIRKWAKRHLGRSNHFTLEQRLKALIARSSEPVQSMVGEAPEFTALVAKIRNFQAHQVPELADDRVGGAQKLAMCEALVVVVHDFLLGHIGVDEATRSTAVGRSRRLRKAQDLIRRFWPAI